VNKNGTTISIGASQQEPEKGWSALNVLTFQATSSFTINMNGTIINVQAGNIFVIYTGADDTAWFKKNLPANLLSDSQSAYNPNTAAAVAAAAVAAAQAQYH
jgi:hypothetical protein